MSRRTPTLYLQDIKQSINLINDYIKDLSQEDFSKDFKTIDAVIRNLEIIGEAAKQMHAEFKDKYPEIPWSDMISMRNKVMHEYFGVDTEILWKTIEEDLPPLEEQITNLLES